jgi:hypothetical protein
MEYFGLSDAAAESELVQAYEKMKSGFYDGLFLKGKEGRDAADNMTRLEESYSEAKGFIINRDFCEGNADITAMINRAIASNDVYELQTRLDAVIEKTAFWHYVEAVAFYIKKLYFDAMEHLRQAVLLSDRNVKYAKALFRLEEKILMESAND